MIHTPGPWIALPATKTGVMADVVHHGTHSGLPERIAGVGAHGQLIEELNANARLIAAAPALLEAAQAGLEALNHIGDLLNAYDMASPESVDAVTPAFQKLRAAIKEATL